MQTWEDPRLTWNPSVYGGIEYIYTKQDNIWHPELIVDNSKFFFTSYLFKKKSYLKMETAFDYPALTKMVFEYVLILLFLLVHQLTLRFF